VACHGTAARLWGFDVLEDPTLHFLGPPGLVNRSRPGIRVHPSSLGCDNAVRIDGVWCTPAPRTACDVVRLSAPIDGLAVLDAALRSAWCTRKTLAEAAAAQTGLRQVIRLRELIPHANGRAESAMESRMRWRFIEGGLPAPEVQVRVQTDDGVRWLDTGWREQRVGSEFDGLEAHMTPEQLRDDRHRHNWLTERDWFLLHSPGTTSTGSRDGWSRRRLAPSADDHEVREATRWPRAVFRFPNFMIAGEGGQKTERHSRERRPTT
jgi:hypothetical protein